jgi:membrane protein DedA with SNARE-associated domain
MLEAIIAPLKAWAESVILQMGYPGIALLMLIDSVNIPIPSEVIMPFGGILAAQGKLNYIGVGIAGTVGTVIGSMVNYWIGAKLGKEGLIKYGKYILIRKKEVEHGEEWFGKYGDWVTLWGRFIPLVRTFISLPAGLYRMNFAKFMLFATLGAAPWAFGWAYVGFQLEAHMETIEKNWKYLDYVVVAVILFFIVRIVIKRLKERNTPEATQAD